MSAPRWSQALAAATVGLLVAAIATPAAAQASCTIHSCTAVQRVQVTVPTRLGLSGGGGPGATVRANTAWRLDVSAVATAPSKVTEIRDTPAASAAAVRYTLVGT